MKTTRGIWGLMRAALPYTSAAALIAVLYLGWIFGGRYFRDRQLERAAEAQQAESLRKFHMPGSGKGVEILQFYASPGVLTRGQKAVLCYGVVNAESVRMEPEVEPLTPSLNRCINVAPVKSTEYKLTAQGADGKTVSAAFVLQVKPGGK